VCRLRLGLHLHLLHGQYFFHAAQPDLRGYGDDDADAAFDRHTVPRFPHADAVHLAPRESVGSKWRRYSNDFHIVIRVDATRDQPVAQHIVVAGISVNDTQSRFARRGPDDVCKALPDDADIARLPNIGYLRG